MKRTRNTRRARLLATMSGTTLALAIGAGALGADEKPADPKADPASVLSGPQVEDRDVPGASSTFGDSEMKPPQDRERPVLHRAFMMALRDLGGDEAPAGVRATPEQIDQVREIDREFRDLQRAYMQEHREEMRDLMRQVRPRDNAGPDDAAPRERGRPGQRAEPGARRPGRGGPPDENAAPGPGPGGPPDGARNRGRAPIDPESLSDEQRAAFERVKEIRAAGPQPEAFHARMWELLTPEQRTFVENRLAEIREGGEAMLRQRARGEAPPERRQGEPRRDRERRLDRNTDKDGARDTTT